MNQDALTFQDINLDEPRMRRPIGGTGTHLTSGLDIYNTEDYHAKFRGAEAVKTCDDVRRDPVVSAGIRHVNDPIGSMEWGIDPGKSQRGKAGKMEASDLDKKIADAAREDFIDRHYGEGIQSIQGFPDIMRHILEMDVYGFSAFCTWWSLGDSGRHVVEFEPRLQSSITRFRVDKVTRGLAAMFQNVLDPETGRWGEVPIPVDQLALFTWRQQGDNYWGMPGLREVFKPWDLKRRLELIDAIGLEKHAVGVDELHATEQMNSDQERNAQQLVQNVRAHQRGGILTPDYLEYTLHSTDGNGTGCNPSIARLNEEILLALACEGLLMGGTSAKGNRSLGEVKQEDALMGLQAIVNRIKAIFSRQLLRKWTIVNFGPQPAYPQLGGEPLDKMSGTVLAELLKLGREAGVLTPGKKTETWYREIITAPEEDEPYQDPAQPPPVPAGVDPATGEPVAGDPVAGDPVPTPAPKKVAASASAAASRFHGGPRVYWRDAFPHEAHIAFDDMANYLDEEPRRIWERVVRNPRADIIDFLAKHYSQASDIDQVKRDVKIPGEAQLSADLYDALLSVYRKGRVSVVNDRRRQLAGSQQPILASNAADYEGDEEDFSTEPSKKQNSWMKRIAEGFTTAILGSLITEAIRSGQISRDANRDASRQERDIRTALGPPPNGNVSEDAQVATLGGKVARSFTNGRVEQGQAMQDQWTSVFYTARMDTSTCGPCWAKDGEELDLSDWQNQVPNPNCDWPDACRCAPVFVSREQHMSEAA